MTTDIRFFLIPPPRSDI